MPNMSNLIKGSKTQTFQFCIGWEIIPTQTAPSQRDQELHLAFSTLRPPGINIFYSLYGPLNFIP